MSQGPLSVCWPKKHDLFGVHVSVTNYEEACECIIVAAKKRISAAVDHMPVHGLITADKDALFKKALNSFEIVAPDGQPVRWALNLLHKAGLRDRVYGPDLMLMICGRAAQEAIPIFLYGSTGPVLEALNRNLLARFPGLFIVGTYSPPFRDLTPDEDNDIIERINNSGAAIVFIGLGCPKQEFFAHTHKNRIKAVLMCVGAAFDFHAGTKPQAPRWMQKRGLEWVFRLISEPGRLWKRYTVTNSLFAIKLLVALLRNRTRHASTAK